VYAQYDRLTDAIDGKLPTVAAHLDAARADVLAFTGFPKGLWRQIWSNNPRNASTGRSAGAPTSSGSSPAAIPLIRLIGAVLAEQHDEWTEGRRYHGLDVLTRSRITIAPATTEVTPDNGIQHSAPNPEQRITR
jgi:putative transposase